MRQDLTCTAATCAIFTFIKKPEIKHYHLNSAQTVCIDTYYAPLPFKNLKRLFVLFEGGTPGECSIFNLDTVQLVGNQVVAMDVRRVKLLQLQLR